MLIIYIISVLSVKGQSLCFSATNTCTSVLQCCSWL